MKKLLNIIIGFVALTSLQAANTEVARITLSCDGGAESSFVTLRLDPSVTEAGTTSFFGVTDEAGQVNIYIPYNGGQWSAYKANSLTNATLNIITNRRDDHYTLSFNVPTSTEGLTLTDLATGTITPITNGGSYGFYVNTTLHPDYVAGTNYVVSGRFYINYDATLFSSYTVTPNEDGYATFSATEATKIPAGVTVYKGAIDGEVLNLTAITGYVPANTGVIVKGTAGTSYEFAADGTVAAELTGNTLQPSTAFAAADNIYCLRHVDGEGSGFYRYTGGTMPDNKAYLQLASTPSGAPRRIVMKFDNAQGVENVQGAAVEGVKFMENGQIFIRRGENVYNAQGQMVK